MLGSTTGTGLLIIASVLLIWYSIRPNISRIRLRLTRIVLIFLTVIITINIIEFYKILFSGRIESGFPVPFSMLIASSIVLVFINLSKSPPPGVKPGGKFLTLLTLGFCLVVFPLGQIFCFGKTDYRRKADAIVVFGARVYGSGVMSHALYDRTLTGIRLFHKKFSPILIFSGGPGDGKIHETAAMRKMAIRKKVPPHAIFTDRRGVNTRATVKNTLILFKKRKINRVLAVSHFFHLPRIKMTYQQNGFEVYTVPAQETYILKRTPFYILREIAALWVYYLRPLAGLP